jgi:hypothetical protein
VYLTDTYAGYFAFAAAEEDERWCVLEIETDYLNDLQLVPDEDFLEQGTRNLEVGNVEFPLPPTGASMADRTKFFRLNLGLYWPWAQDSLAKMGNVAFLCDSYDEDEDRDSCIPAEAITRMTLFDPRSNELVAGRVMDAMITILNHMIVGCQHRALTRWLAGYEDIKVEDVCGYGIATDGNDQIARMLREQEVIVGEYLEKRSGLEIKERS